MRDDFEPARSDHDFVVVLTDVTPVAYAECFFSLKEGLEGPSSRPVALVVERDIRAIRNPYSPKRLAWEGLTVYSFDGSF